jgi:UDP-N-acetylglucosamine 3-dehydrogenase
MSYKNLKKVSFGLLGSSNIARRHMKSICANKKTELIAVCSLNEGQLRQAVEDFDIKHSYSDYREMLKNDEIDAVIVATPDQLHAEHTIAMLEAGKHVMCEKPMALTVEECKAMTEASVRTGKKLMLGFICRFTPCFKLAKKLIDNGEIGELFYIEADYPHEVEFMGEGNWRIDPVKKRHPVIGGGSHAIDLMMWAAGKPYEVSAFTSQKVKKDWPMEDFTAALMRFPNDVIGRLMVSFGVTNRPGIPVTYYGSKGTIYTNYNWPHIIIHKRNICEGKKYFEDVLDKTVAMHHQVEVSNHNTDDELEEFVNCIIEDKPVRLDGAHGTSVVAVSRACLESAAKHQIVELDYDFWE